MPCAIDVAGCGRIYFITWTKNGSSLAASSVGDIQSTTPSSSRTSGMKNGAKEWQRVFIHSDTFEKVLGDLEQVGPSGRVTFGPRDSLNTTTFAYLTVRSVSSLDEGVYKCDVTYTTPHAHGKCPSLTYTRVQTLVQPSAPRIRVNGRLLSDYRAESFSAISSRPPSANAANANNVPESQMTDAELFRSRQIGAFEEGSTVVLECSTIGGRPMPELRWYNGTRPLRSKISVSEPTTTAIASVNKSGYGSEYTRLMNDVIARNTASATTSAKHKDSHSLLRDNREVLVATTRIIASRYDLGAKFECRVLWNHSSDYTEDAHWSMHHSRAKLINTSLLHDWMLLDIKVRPLTIKVDSPRSPVVAGETVMLRCSVDGARPAANITWYNRSEVVNALPLPSSPSSSSLSSPSTVAGMQSILTPGAPPGTRLIAELQPDGTYRSSSILVFSATRSDHLADFFCKGSNEVLRNRNEVPLLQGVQLQVLYSPLVAIEPDGIIPVNETSTIQLWCTYDANPINLTEIVWFKNGVPINFKLWSPEKMWTSKDEQGTPILTINDIDRNDSAEYRCRVRNNFGAAESITAANLEVAYPPVVQLEILEPLDQTIVESSQSRPSTGNLLSLRCVTIQGNPAQLTQVRWFQNGRHFLTTYSIKQLHQQQQLLQQQAMATGSASLPPGLQSTGSGLSQFYRISGTKHFTLIDDTLLPLGASNVDRSGPLDGSMFTSFMNASYHINASPEHEPIIHYLDFPEILTITNVTRVFAGNYSCVGFNGAANASVASRTKSIFVKYKPGKTQIRLSGNGDNSYILHGMRAVLECRVGDPGNPRAHSIQWTHNGARIDRPVADEPFPDLDSSSASTQSALFRDSRLIPLIARLRLPLADRSTGGEYSCVAVSELGNGERAAMNLDVRSPPKFLLALPSTIGAQLNQSITLECQIECEPLCQIVWYHNNVTELSPNSRGVFTSTVRNELRAKLRNGNELAFWLETIEHQSSSSSWKVAAAEIKAQYSFTVSKLHILNTSALFDYDKFSCSSSGNNLGSPLQSSISFRREFAPYSVQISVPQIDLLEGERYPEKPVQCVAFGNPEPNYYWIFSPIFPDLLSQHKQSLQPQQQHHQQSSNSNVDTGHGVVAIGPMLTLNMTTMLSTSMHHHQAVSHNAFHASAVSMSSQQQQQQMADARVATYSSGPGSTVGPSLFRASRVQSGNYTCIANNRHGSHSTTMSINVFYRPECELRRINQAKVFRQRTLLPAPAISTSPSNDNPHHQDNHFSSDPQTNHNNVLISCSASSNPAPMSFSWYRRNSTASASAANSLIEIHPSPETDHSLFVAIQDYDYEDDSGAYRNLANNAYAPYQADQQFHHSTSDAAAGHAHARQSAVLSVPDYADLNEYACVVQNLIGKSEPCWFTELPAFGPIRSREPQSSWSIFGSNDDNLFVVAATAGVIVFLVVASGAVVIVVCLHRHRTPSFKGFIGTGSSGGSSSGGGTPQRFKLDRNAIPVSAVHHLLDSSPDMNIDFISALDNRSKTATLTAAYRMTNGKNAAGTMAATSGTLKNYRTLQQHHHLQQHHPYVSSSVIGSTGNNNSVNGGGGGSGGESGVSTNGGASGVNRPFLVSYPSSNVYAEPDYHGGASSNHSGEQLTGSTTVTNVSIGNNNNNNGVGAGVNTNASSISLPHVSSSHVGNGFYENPSSIVGSDMIETEDIIESADRVAGYQFGAGATHLLSGNNTGHKSQYIEPDQYNIRNNANNDIYENGYPTYEELEPKSKLTRIPNAANALSTQNSPYYYQHTSTATENAERQNTKISAALPPIASSATHQQHHQRSVTKNLRKTNRKSKTRKTKTKTKSKFYTSPSGESPSSSSLASSGVDEDNINDEEEGEVVEENKKEQQQQYNQIIESTVGRLEKYRENGISSQIDHRVTSPSDFRSYYATQKYGTRPAYLHHAAGHFSESEDSESTSHSAAYNPERDFYYDGHANLSSGPIRPASSVTRIYEQPHANDHRATNTRGRRMLPSQTSIGSANGSKYGSLLQQPEHSTNYRSYQQPPPQPHQYQASPVSTRIYFNFAEQQNHHPPHHPIKTMQSHNSSTQLPSYAQQYNSLRRNGSGTNWIGSERTGAAAANTATTNRKNGSSSPPPCSTILQTFTTNGNSGAFRNAEPNHSVSDQAADTLSPDASANLSPPDYHRVFDN